MTLSSPDIEQMVLGAILLDADALPLAEEVIEGDDFAYDSHRLIYNSILRVRLKDLDPDPQAVIDDLRTQDALALANGETYIYSLATSTPDSSQVSNHAKLLKQKSILRRFSNLCEKHREAAESGIENPADLLAEHENAIALLSGEAQTRRASKLAESLTALQSQFATSTVQDGEGEYQTLIRTTGIVPTKIPDIDKVMGGFEPGELILLAGQTSHGKSAFALEMAQRMAASGIAIGLFTLEMTQTQIVARILARAANINGRKFRTGRFDRGEMGRLKRAYEEMAQLPIIIDDTPNLTLENLKARSRQMMIRDGVKLIILDNLELMERRGRKDDEEGYQNTLAASRYLKQMAGDLEIPVLVLRQLTRDTQRDLVEARKRKTPGIGRIRYAGEHDANCILLLVDTDYENRQLTLDDPHQVELYVAKGRDVGSSAKPITFTYMRQYHRFADARDEDAEG